MFLNPVIKHESNIWPSLCANESVFAWMCMCSSICVCLFPGRVPTFQPGGHARRQEVRNGAMVMSPSWHPGADLRGTGFGTRPVIHTDVWRSSKQGSAQQSFISTGLDGYLNETIWEYFGGEMSLWTHRHLKDDTWRLFSNESAEGRKLLRAHLKCEIKTWTYEVIWLHCN